jgi:hypothetical protein
LKDKRGVKIEEVYLSSLKKKLKDERGVKIEEVYLSSLKKIYF